jgi:hypothetical protein
LSAPPGVARSSQGIGHFKIIGASSVHAVNRAARDPPPFLEKTYRDARNYVAYCMK